MIKKFQFESKEQGRIFYYILDGEIVARYSDRQRKNRIKKAFSKKIEKVGVYSEIIYQEVIEDKDREESISFNETRKKEKLMEDGANFYDEEKEMRKSINTDDIEVFHIRNKSLFGKTKNTLIQF
jgi:hypothetical protein